MENLTDKVVARVVDECGCSQTEYLTTSEQRYSKTSYCNEHRPKLISGAKKSTSLEWSEPEKPNEDSMYTHVMAETPLGRIVIEWKGWKDPILQHPDAVMPWGEHVIGDDLEDAKTKVQQAWDRKIATLR